MVKKEGFSVTTHTKIKARSGLGKALIKGNRADISGMFDITVEDLKPIRDHMLSFWRVNIYDTFDARSKSGHKSSGQLGKSLISKIGGKKSGGGIKFYMKPIYSRHTKDYTKEGRTEVLNVERTSTQPKFKTKVTEKYSDVSQTSWEYGSFLRKGTQRNKTMKYNKHFDRLVHTGSREITPTTGSKGLNTLIRTLGRPTSGGQRGVSKRRWQTWMNIFRKELRKSSVEILTKRFDDKDYAKAGGKFR